MPNKVLGLAFPLVMNGTYTTFSKVQLVKKHLLATCPSYCIEAGRDGGFIVVILLSLFHETHISSFTCSIWLRQPFGTTFRKLGRVEIVTV